MIVTKILAIIAAALFAMCLAPYLLSQRYPLQAHAFSTLRLSATINDTLLQSELVTYTISPNRGSKESLLNHIIITNLEPGTYTVEAQHRYGKGVATILVEPGADVEATIPLRTYDVNTQTGRFLVLEARSKEPLAGVQIRIDSTEWQTTDSEGGVTRHGLARGKNVSVQARYQDSLIADFELPLNNAARNTYVSVASMLGRAPVENGLLAWYPMNGNWRDAGPNGYHGEIRQGGVAPTMVENRTGITNGALHFDINTDPIVIPDAPWQRIFPLTVSFWMKVSSTTKATAFIMGKYLHPSGEGWLIFFENGLLCAEQTHDKFTSYTRLNSVFTRDEKWHHVAFTINETQLDLYVDGARTPARRYVGTPRSTNTQQPISIGGLTSTIWSPSPGLIGDLDNVMIFDRVLNEAEVRELLVATY